jgi:hypothetical protein
MKNYLIFIGISCLILCASEITPTSHRAVPHQLNRALKLLSLVRDLMFNKNHSEFESSPNFFQRLNIHIVTFS